jgi:hypothetical protein
MTHKAIIETRIFFWRKRYRFICANCGEKGLWRKTFVGANADGWYHDDATLFDLLTRPPGRKQ